MLPVRIVPQDMPTPMSVTLRYAAEDPYAVRATFRPLDHSTTVEWILSRDMLAEALSGHTGDADVRMWPAGGAGRDRVYIALRSPAGSTVLELSTRSVTSFLRATSSVVAPGSESSRLDLNRELARLLA